jgi:amino acid transporter
MLLTGLLVLGTKESARFNVIITVAHLVLVVFIIIAGTECLWMLTLAAWHVAAGASSVYLQCTMCVAAAPVGQDLLSGIHWCVICVSSRLRSCEGQAQQCTAIPAF